MNKGHYIVFEGPSGVGKDKQLQLAKKYLESRGVTCTEIKEPDFLRPQLMQFFKFSEKQPIAEAALFAADRAINFHLNGVIDKINQGEVILASRNVLSSLTYQHLIGVDFEFLLKLNSSIPNPDLAFVFITDANTAYQRCLARQNSPGGKPLSAHETPDQLEALNWEYIHAAGRVPNCKVIDATPSEDQITKIITADLASLIFNEKSPHLNIGLDLDGVVNEIGRVKADAARRLYSLDIPIEHFNKKDAIQYFGSFEEYRAFEKRVYNDEETNRMIPIDPEAKEFISKLINDGHNVKILTSRGDNETRLARLWLRDKSLLIPLINAGYATDDSKAKKSEGMKLDVYIDDGPHKLKGMVGKIPNLFLMVRPYYKDVSEPGITRVNSWTEFYQKVRDLATQPVKA